MALKDSEKRHPGMALNAREKIHPGMALNEWIKFSGMALKDIQEQFVGDCRRETKLPGIALGETRGTRYPGMALEIKRDSYPGMALE